MWQNWIVWACDESNTPTVSGATVSCDGARYDGDECIVTPNDNVSCDGVSVSCSSGEYVVNIYCKGKKSKSFCLKDMCWEKKRKGGPL